MNSKDFTNFLDTHTTPNKIIVPAGKKINASDLSRIRAACGRAIPVRYVVPGSVIKISAI
jgi:hypothetical protein